MRKFLLLLSLLSFSYGYSQRLPIDFESDVNVSNFIYFDGGLLDIVANPAPTGINSSAMVGVIVRDGGAIWGGSKIALAENLDCSERTVISMKVYTPAPVGTVVKLKLEGAPPFAEVDAPPENGKRWNIFL